jgi:hypothetical protein
MERIAAVTRSRVDHGARVRTGALGDLTDVHIHEALADELTHQTIIALSLLPGGVDRLVGVLDQALRAADGTRDVVATVEIAEILRGLERFLERGLRETQGGAQSFELTLIDFRRH